jgi:hypothetical protein
MQHITRGALAASAKLTPQQLNRIQFGSYLMGCLWRAGQETGTLEVMEVRAMGHCLLAASALVDVLHSLGHTEAAFHRSGLNLSMYRHGELSMTATAGHPSAPQNRQLWNAHMTVRWGDIILDPTFGQLQADWNSVPLFTTFLLDRTKRATFELYGFGEVEAFASLFWKENDRTFAARLFRLPHKVDAATRKWRDRPDAMPERRGRLVQRTLELVAIDALSKAGIVPREWRSEDDQA